ncbi:reverse transcriptase domain-containing protein [Tanacetum coccineum]
MAEIGCNWARIGPSKSSQSLSNAHKWAAGRQGKSYSGTVYKGNATSFGGNNASRQARVVKCYNCSGEGHMARQCTQPKRPRNAAWFKDKAMLAEAQEAGQILDEEQLTFLPDPRILDDNEITSDSNIISYSQYLKETQQETIQDTNLQAQQDSIILSVIEQMSEQMINHVNNWEKANKDQNSESVTAELEGYKERLKTFEQRLNVNVSTREKMIDSQMDDMIKENLALKQQVDSLKQNLSKQIKEKESLLQTIIVFKNESKEKENKYMENKIDLKKKIKELDNIIYKVGQSAQTVHMLTKPQVFYDNAHKQALGYQNPFYLKKAQRIKPTLYDGIIISDKHVVMPVKLNQLYEDFEKRFIPQQEFLTEQDLWYHMSNPSIESSNASPVKIKAPKELPKVSLVNESLKKLKFHLTNFDKVVKKRTTPDARTEGEWGFEHTKAVFNNEIIPFLKSLKDIFNVFDKDLPNEIMEV